MLSRPMCWVCAVPLVCALSCGESGSRATRPIEVIYYVTGVSGTRFQALGFQAANADHQLAADREFVVPHFFVLENAFQFDPPAYPVRGTFEAIDDSITVFVIFGIDPAPQPMTLRPGERATVPCNLDADSRCLPDVDPPPTPRPSGPEIRFEVCTASTESTDNTPCPDLLPPVPPNIAFDITVGDISGTNVTLCSVVPAAVDTCRTSLTLFLEDVSEQVTGVFQKLPDENRDARLRAELYINDRLSDSGISRQDPIILDENL